MIGVVNRSWCLIGGTKEGLKNLYVSTGAQFNDVLGFGFETDEGNHSTGPCCTGKSRRYTT